MTNRLAPALVRLARHPEGQHRQRLLAERLEYAEVLHDAHTADRALHRAHAHQRLRPQGPKHALLKQGGGQQALLPGPQTQRPGQENVRSVGGDAASFQIHAELRQPLPVRGAESLAAPQRALRELTLSAPTTVQQPLIQRLGQFQTAFQRRGLQVRTQAFRQTQQPRMARQPAAPQLHHFGLRLRVGHAQ
ncbi:hypothetical protein JOS77_16465 [Chromobacterium haemolyticum]|nr:hypothetical protein JOS77_16465 [Chromobacterium haemolyticum]